MLDEANVDQQEALGVIGVNLIYGAFYYHQPEKLIASLHENLPPQRIAGGHDQVFRAGLRGGRQSLDEPATGEPGPDDAVMFTADGESVQPAEVLYKKRSSWSAAVFALSPTRRTTCWRARAQIFLSASRKRKDEDLVVLMEMTLENLLSEGQLDHADFLARVDILGSLGRTVLISKFGEYYRLAGYLSRYTNKMVALVMGVPSLHGDLRRKILSATSKAAFSKRSAACSKAA